MPNNPRIKDLHTDNLPRERLLQKGPEALSDIELLAILLGSGGKDMSALELSNRLLSKGNLKQVLEMRIPQLTKIRHIGQAKAVTLKTVYEISKRINYETTPTETKISSAKDVYKTVRKDFVGKKQEQIILLSLDARKRLIAKNLISLGTINETLFPTREIVKTALLNNAVSVVVVHNHPSNDATPSKEDLEVTKTLIEACKLCDIGFFDHVIVTDKTFLSLNSFSKFKIRGMKGGE